MICEKGSFIMVKKLNEVHTPMGEVNTLDPIGDLIKRLRSQLDRLSSVYENADELATYRDWTSLMTSKYLSAHQSGVTALSELSECVAYMIEFEAEAEAESNYTDDEDWYDDTEV